MIHHLGAFANPYALLQYAALNPPSSTGTTAAAAAAADPSAASPQSVSGPSAISAAVANPNAPGGPPAQNAVSGFAPAFQQLSPDLQAELLRIQSTDAPETSVDPSANAGTSATATATAASGQTAAAAANGTGGSSTGQVSGHRHHHHHAGGAAQASTQDPLLDSPSAPSDTDSAVSQFLSMMQGITGAGGTGAGSAAASTSAALTAGTPSSVQSTSDIFAQNLVQSVQASGVNQMAGVFG